MRVRTSLRALILAACLLAPASLSNAQQTTEEATALALRAQAEALESAAWTLDTDDAEGADLLGALPEAEGDQPFQHPYYWGAWVFYGA